MQIRLEDVFKKSWKMKSVTLKTSSRRLGKQEMFAGMQQNLFNFFLPQEAGAFRSNIEKKPQKPHPKLKKYVCYRFTDNICCLQSNASGNFLQKCINFVE